MAGPVTKAARLLEWLKNQWATRSLAVGAVSTVFDLGIGGTLLWAGAPTRAAAMTGTLFGSVFSYFANRSFAFRDRDPSRSTFLRYAAVTVVASTIHGQFVVWFSGLGLPYVAAKMASDFIVYTVGQLLLLRYVVFPRKISGPPASPEGAVANRFATSTPDD